MEFSTIVINYLESCHLKFSTSFLSNQLTTHPEYPSLVSLTDTLDELGLEYSAVKAEKGRHKDLKYPLLALVTKNRKLIFVQVDSSEIFSRKGILETWTGICIFLKQDQKIENSDHNQWLVRDKTERTLHLTLTSIIVFIALIATISHYSLTALLLLILSMVGCGLCGLFIIQGLGKHNIVLEQLCSAKDDSVCEKIKNKKTGRWKNIGLDDIGLIYFFSLGSYISIMSASGNWISAYMLLTIPILLGPFVSIASVLYQWRLLKGWCRICLLVSMVIWLQTIVLCVGNSEFSFADVSINAVVIYTFVVLASGLIWASLKSIINALERYKKSLTAAIRLKRNPAIFLSLLLRQHQITTKIEKDEIFFGNPEARLQFLVVCNPFCSPCALTHFELDKMLLNFPKEIGLSVRFAIRAEENSGDKKVIAAMHILNAYLQGNKKSVKDWFSTMKIESYSSIYACGANEKETLPILKKHEAWVKSAHIKVTPTLFLNGFEVPKEYRISELNSMILQLSSVIDYEIQNRSHSI